MSGTATYERLKKAAPKYKSTKEAIQDTIRQLELIASRHKRSAVQHFGIVETKGRWSEEDRKFHGLYCLLGALRSKP
jgi:hypothetical protein